MKPLFLMFLLLIVSCKKPMADKNYLGIVNIEVTGKQEAIPHFEKGLLLLHSFEYIDAREAFNKAQEIDPEMSMAYWGEAMTHNHSLWKEQDLDQALEVVNKINKLEKAIEITELERDFLRAVNTLYTSDSIKTIRDKNYADFMQKLSYKYPDNHEVAAFYALSLLGSVADGRDDTIYGKGAVIAKGILKENPKHPGALHYLIHSYDDPGHAKLALEAANSYSVVAPDASHALHMPSHIYVALGMWDQVVSSNENSYQASVNRMKANKLNNDARGYHAFHWLEYGYLQQGEMEKAKKLVEDMKLYTEETPSRRARSHMVFLKGTYLIESEAWESEIADFPIDIDDLNVSVRSQYNFVEGVKAFIQNDNPSLLKYIDAIKNDYDKETYLVSYDNASFCSGANRYQTSPSMLVETEIMMTQLMALKSWMNDDPNTTEKLLLKAVDLEDGLSYSYGPPVIQKPTHELYGDWLVEQGRPNEAEVHYQATLTKAPKRRLAEERIKQLSKS